MAHGHADIGGAQGRRIVYPVAGDGHKVPLVPKPVHEVEFLMRGHAREDPGLLDFVLQFLGGLLLQFRPRHHPFRWVGQPQFAGDRERGDGVIPGDHADFHAGVVTILNGFANPSP